MNEDTHAVAVKQYSTVANAKKVVWFTRVERKAALAMQLCFGLLPELHGLTKKYTIMFISQ